MASPLRSAARTTLSLALALASLACSSALEGMSGSAGSSGAAGAPGSAGTTASAGTSGTAGTTGAAGAAGTTGASGATGAGGVQPPAGLIGWAASGCTMGSVTTTTGGGAAAPVTVTTIADFNANAAGNGAKVIQVSGTLSGSVSIGSNKTIIGMPGASIVGHVDLDRSVNVILQNLTIVGLNCADVVSNATPDCQDGADAITVDHGAHHIWIDHLDVSDGSDGNLDITNASDCVTVSWTKFHYSASRVAGYSGEVHHFSNLVGASDTDTGDTGHLRITWHHDWWADHVVERQPRVRFGQVHVFNSLYTGSGDSYCIGVGVSANILDENNAFVGVKNPIDSADYSNTASIVVSKGNVYTSTSGATTNKGSAAFTPPYPYTLDATSGLQAAVMAGAGPQ
jgi:pectate lyase